MPRASRKLIKNTLGVVNAWGGKIKVAGEIIFFAGATPPSGFLAANGQLVSRATYANLFAAIGTTHGAGDGSTTFQLPDLRGEFLRGLDGGRGVDAGRSLGSQQNDATKAHNHAINQAAAVGGDQLGIVLGGTGLGYDITTSGRVQNTGGTETRPRNIALLACIQY